MSLQVPLISTVVNFSGIRFTRLAVYKTFDTMIRLSRSPYEPSNLIPLLGL